LNLISKASTHFGGCFFVTWLNLSKTLVLIRLEDFTLMFQSEDDFPQDPSQNAPNSASEPNLNLDSIDANLSIESVTVRKKQLESVFLKLIILGLTLGTILGISAYYLLHKFGLTKKPYQLEQEKIEREREANPDTSINQIVDFPASDAHGHRFQI
jgi:hypothetical protein